MNKLQKIKSALEFSERFIEKFLDKGVSSEEALSFKHSNEEALEALNEFMEGVTPKDISTAPKDGTWILASFWATYATDDDGNDLEDFIAWDTFRWVGDCWESADNECYCGDDNLIDWLPLPKQQST